MCLWSIQSYVAARGPRGEGRRREGGEDWRLDTLMWKGGSGLEGLSRPSQPRLDVVIARTWVCVCVATSRRGNEIQNAKYVGEVSHA